MFRIITIEELLKLLDGYNHQELHVHHTYEPNHADFNGNNGIELQEAMRNYHVNTLGWADIGQHVTLLPNGLFVTGRDFGRTPASISGKNTGAFACETLGNFDTGHDVLQGTQKDSLLKLAKYFDDKRRYVRFHRENSPKTCPGTPIDKDIFMNEVRALGKIANQQPTPVPVNNTRHPKNNVYDFKSLQGYIGVVQDNIPGPITLNHCPLTKKGAKGNIVKWIQARLNYLGFNCGAVDGDFGNKTLAAVSVFQKSRGLSADGIIGKNTWRKLLGL